MKKVQSLILSAASLEINCRDSSEENKIDNKSTTSTQNETISGIAGKKGTFCISCYSALTGKTPALIIFAVIEFARNL